MDISNEDDACYNIAGPPTGVSKDQRDSLLNVDN
jgi:hypothetical protein